MKFKVSDTQALGSALPQKRPGFVRGGGCLPPSPCNFLPQEMNQNVNPTTITPTNAEVKPTAADGLAQGLAAALQAGLTEKAAELAVELANLNVKCEIKVLHEVNKQRSRHAEFDVKVHVEDRVSDRCYIIITVKAVDTIEDLKRKMMILHNLPMEVQRWIIGKKIHTDQTTLYQCGVRGPGHTLYLYLVTARSVGLSKANYEAQLQAIMLMKQASTQISQQISSEPSNHSVGLDPASQGITFSPSNISSEGDSLDQTAVVPITVRPAVYPSSSSVTCVSPGSVRIQEMLQSPILSGFSPNPPSGTPSTPVENVLTHASPGLNIETWSQKPTTVSTNFTTTTSATSNVNNIGTAAQILYPPSPTSGLPTENDEEIEGWECPICTYRNLPMWPGCEMCNKPRPEEYQVPANYQMTEREMHLMQNEQMVLHEPPVTSTNTQQQQESEVSQGRFPKLRGNLELLQNLQATQVMPTNTNSNNINGVTDVFASNNSIILRNISNEQEDNDLTAITPQPVGDLSDVLQAIQFERHRSQLNRTAQDRPMTYNFQDVPPYRANAIYGHQSSSDEENSSS
ncbi:hypothetical protein RRG08_000151 [Elysia crispata]|uniref:RanBP2-type domain-containing protein n=1 Tax=Elysia crispata TaxID=231223 RepID=A0AAE0YV30_9GAST|nr:hypothetical protein RRG08_000151 [Elysia crispata]